MYRSSPELDTPYCCTYPQQASRSSAQAQRKDDPKIELFPIAIIVVALFAFLVTVAVLAFWIWMLIDCAIHESSEGNDKIIWILIILLTNWIGALIYFFARRPTRKRKLGQ